MGPSHKAARPQLETNLELLSRPKLLGHLASPTVNSQSVEPTQRQAAAIPNALGPEPLRPPRRGPYAGSAMSGRPPAGHDRQGTGDPGWSCWALYLLEVTMSFFAHAARLEVQRNALQLKLLSSLAKCGS